MKPKHVTTQMKALIEHIPLVLFVLLLLLLLFVFVFVFHLVLFVLLLLLLFVLLFVFVFVLLLNRAHFSVFFKIDLDREMWQCKG